MKLYAAYEGLSSNYIRYSLANSSFTKQITQIVQVRIKLWKRNFFVGKIYVVPDSINPMLDGINTKIYLWEWYSNWLIEIYNLVISQMVLFANSNEKIRGPGFETHHVTYATYCQQQSKLIINCILIIAIKYGMYDRLNW